MTASVIAPLIEKLLRGESSSFNSNGKSSRVRFLNVTISEHPIIVGDNPGAHEGPPVTVAWESVSLVTIDIDQYEKDRNGERRSLGEMKIPPRKRRSMLLDLGFTRKEINRGLKAANITRAQRRRTIAKLNRSFVWIASARPNFATRKPQLRKNLLTPSVPRETCSNLSPIWVIG